jgi:hypothetical protein
MGVLKSVQSIIVVNNILRMQLNSFKTRSSIGSGRNTSYDSRFRRSHSHPCSVGPSVAKIVVGRILTIMFPWPPSHAIVLFFNMDKRTKEKGRKRLERTNHFVIDAQHELYIM